MPFGRLRRRSSSSRSQPSISKQASSPDLRAGPTQATTPRPSISPAPVMPSPLQHSTTAPASSKSTSPPSRFKFLNSLRSKTSPSKPGADTLYAPPAVPAAVVQRQRSRQEDTPSEERPSMSSFTLKSFRSDGGVRLDAIDTAGRSGGGRSSQPSSPGLGPSPMGFNGDSRTSFSQDPLQRTSSPGISASQFRAMASRSSSSLAGSRRSSFANEAAAPPGARVRRNSSKLDLPVLPPIATVRPISYNSPTLEYISTMDSPSLSSATSPGSYFPRGSPIMLTSDDDPNLFQPPRPSFVGNRRSSYTSSLAYGHDRHGSSASLPHLGPVIPSSAGGLAAPAPIRPGAGPRQKSFDATVKTDSDGSEAESDGDSDDERPRHAWDSAAAQQRRLAAQRDAQAPQPHLPLGQASLSLNAAGQHNVPRAPSPKASDWRTSPERRTSPLPPAHPSWHAQPARQEAVKFGDEDAVERLGSSPDDDEPLQIVRERKISTASAPGHPTRSPAPPLPSNVKRTHRSQSSNVSISSVAPTRLRLPPRSHSSMSGALTTLSNSSDKTQTQSGQLKELIAADDDLPLLSFGRASNQSSDVSGPPTPPMSTSNMSTASRHKPSYSIPVLARQSASTIGGPTHTPSSFQPSHRKSLSLQSKAPSVAGSKDEVFDRMRTRHRAEAQKVGIKSSPSTQQLESIPGSPSAFGAPPGVDARFWAALPSDQKLNLILRQQQLLAIMQAQASSAVYGMPVGSFGLPMPAGTPGWAMSPPMMGGSMLGVPTTSSPSMMGLMPSSASMVGYQSLTDLTAPRKPWVGA